MRIESNICLFDPAPVARMPPQSWWARALHAVSTLWRRGDDHSLRALAALDDDAVENLSEYGQRLRAAARSAEERRRTGARPRSSRG